MAIGKTDKLAKAKVKRTVTGFATAGGDEAKKVAKATWQKMKAAMKKKMPAKWPKDTVVDNTRWAGWLPKDWTIGLKLTEKGFLLQCFVGPPPECKRFFHKPAIEAHIGRKLSGDERGEPPKALQDMRLEKRIEKTSDRVAGMAESEFSLGDYMKYTGIASGLQYMNERCHQAHGRTIRDVLAKLKYQEGDGKTNGGKIRSYTLPDLRYDLKAGRVELVKTKAEVAGKAPPIPTGLATQAYEKKSAKPSNDKRRVSACVATSASAVSAKRARKEPAAAEKAASARAGTSTKENAAPSRATTSTKAPSPRATASTKEAKTAGVADAAAWEIYDTVRKQAACGVVPSQDVFALIGVGWSLKIDSLLLDVLPAVLAKSPKDRGDFGELALKQLEAAMEAKRPRC